jgi:hypothetical protein
MCGVIPPAFPLSVFFDGLIGCHDASLPKSPRFLFDVQDDVAVNIPIIIAVLPAILAGPDHAVHERMYDAAAGSPGEVVGFHFPMISEVQKHSASLEFGTVAVVPQGDFSLVVAGNRDRKFIFQADLPPFYLYLSPSYVLLRILLPDESATILKISVIININAQYFYRPFYPI